MLLNIELKGPVDEPWVSKYDYNLAAQKVVQLITQYNIGYKTMVASLRPRILDSVILASQNLRPREFLIHSALNKIGRKATLGYTTPEHVIGTNINYGDLMEETIRKFKSENKLIGVWFQKKSQPESKRMRTRVFTIEGGVDFFLSDNPLEAMKIRDSL